MRLALASLAAIASFVASEAAFAADAPQSAQPAKKAGFDQNQIVCKMVAVTGSHLGGKRVCLTWAEWDAQSQSDQRALSDAVMRPGTSGVTSNFGAGNGESAGGRMR